MRKNLSTWIPALATPIAFVAGWLAHTHQTDIRAMCNISQISWNTPVWYEQPTIHWGGTFGLTPTNLYRVGDSGANIRLVNLTREQLEHQHHLEKLIAQGGGKYLGQEVTVEELERSFERSRAKVKDWYEVGDE